MGGEREHQRHWQDGEEAEERKRMAEERQVRGSKRLEAFYQAGFRDGYELGKRDAEAVRVLTEQIYRETVKRADEGLERARGEVKPRRARRKRDQGGALSDRDPALLS